MKTKMAAPLTKSAACVLRLVCSSRSQALTPSLSLCQQYATSCKELDTGRSLRIAAAPDKSCIICWHPEPEFPYECTQPIPRTEESAEGDSPLKMNLVLEEKLRSRPTGPTDNELSNMFFTTKHQWRPMTQKKYRKPEKPLDREGL